MLRELRSWDVDRTTLEEMIALAHFGKGLRAEYEARNVPTPEWLDDRLRQLNRAIEAQTRDALELRLKEITAQEAQLLTAGEKRERLAAEKALLTAKLAGGQ